MIEYHVTRSKGGMAVGMPLAVEAAARVLAEGGNAVDAAVTAGLVSGVVAPGANGIGGYGGHMVVAMRRAGGDGREPFGVTAIDFNSTAPVAARDDMFADLWDGSQGDPTARGGRNIHGPLAVGVPATLAGLQLALDRFGTRTFRESVQPAIAYCTDGFPAPRELAAVSARPGPSMQRFADTMALLRPGGEPVREGDTFRNPDLGRMLQALADGGSVASFYEGEIGRQIAAYLQSQGGILTAEDMVAYRAREVAPLELSWRGLRIYTAPLTAGGLTVLQALRTLAALGWDRGTDPSPEAHQIVVEAARAAWHDRLARLGDPEQSEIAVEDLLSEARAQATAERVRAAVESGQRLQGPTDGGEAGGTVHMSFADSQGNVVALTQTHGGGYGSQVTVGGLGLTLGHGMSRFTAQPGHPNSPGPRKRPLHNMCPSIVLRDGVPILTVGGTGGRRIVNAVLHALLHFAGRGAPIGEALAAPRFHTEGGDTCWVDEEFPGAASEHLTGLGYDVQRGAVANVHGIQLDPASGERAGLTEPRREERGRWGVISVESPER